MVLRRILKFLFIAVVFAVPIFSFIFEHKQTKKSVIIGPFGYNGGNFTEKCIRVSSDAGVDVDIKELESLYEPYDSCVREVGNYGEFGLGLWNVVRSIWSIYSDSTLYLTDKQKTQMIAFLQYCPKLIKFIRCDDVVSPIYEACYTIAERNETAIGKASWLQMLENICGNNIEDLVKVINSKGLECALSKGFKCFRDYGCSSDPFSNPRLNYYCRFYYMTINCLGPVFKQCDVDQTPDTLMKSFFNNIQSETICEEFLHTINDNINHHKFD